MSDITNRRNPAARNRWKRESVKRIRAAVMAGYGGKCACCGEARAEFLSIDHVHDDGASWRKHGRGDKVMRQILREGSPDSFQILCMNCNWAKGKYGICPHKATDELVPRRQLKRARVPSDQIQGMLIEVEKMLR